MVLVLISHTRLTEIVGVPEVPLLTRARRETIPSTRRLMQRRVTQSTCLRARRGFIKARITSRATLLWPREAGRTRTRVYRRAPKRRRAVTRAPRAQ